MKKTIYFITALIAITSISYAQGYKYEIVRAYAISQGYSIGQEWSCPLEQGDYFTKTFTFECDVEYDIIALSEDDDVLDVDIEILTPFGNTYAKDTRTSAYAEVNFTPSYTRTFTVKVKNYSSNTPFYASKVYFLIAYKSN